MDTGTGDGAVAGGAGTAAEQGREGGAGAGGGAADSAGAADKGTDKSAAGGQGLDRAKLSPLLQGMNEEGINEVFTTLLESVRRPPAEAVPAQAPTQPQGPTAEQLKEMYDPNNDNFDPQKAFQMMAAQTYGPLVRDVSQKALEGLYSSMGQEIHDWDKYGQRVRQALSKRDPTTVTRDDIVGAYLATKGLDTYTKEQEERRTRPATQTLAPSPQATTEEVPKLTKEQESVARVLFRNSPDPIKAYLEYDKKTEFMEVKVPMRGGQKA